jgi:AraC-like DNA-binding protein
VHLNPLFAALPPVIHLRGDDPAVRRWLQPTLDFIHVEMAGRLQGAQTVLRRLADVLFIQAVRAYAARDACDADGGADGADGAGTVGWLRGLSDPRVGRALMLLHARFEAPWTLDTLAAEVGLSRTLLAVRFKALVGESPIGYLTRWRITRAANLLRSGSDSVARVAEKVGYGSEVVFAKAFRRITGMPPGQFRRLRPEGRVAT